MSASEKLYSRFLLFFVYTMGLYYLWSRVGRWIMEHKYRGELDSEFDAEKVQAFLNSCTWRKDPWWQLGDLISYPRKFAKQKRGDCDEFAVAALSMGRHGLKHKEQHYFQIGLLTVNYRKRLWRVAGHNVALFRSDLPDGGRQYIHTGNWGIRGPYPSMEAAAESVWKQVGATPLGYRVTSSNLRRKIRAKIW